MLGEVTALLAAGGPTAEWPIYRCLIVDENALGKSTVSTRRLTAQRLRELYGLDQSVAVFRVLGHLWDLDPLGRQLLALLCAAARDPLLRATATVIINTPVGCAIPKTVLKEAIVEAVGDRLNESIVDKAARNIGSTWTQSGHLVGRVKKTRSAAAPTPAVVAFAMWLGSQQGLRDGELLRSVWVRLLDRSDSAILAFAQEAKRLGLIQLTIGGGVVAIDPSHLDPGRGVVSRGTH